MNYSSKDLQDIPPEDKVTLSPLDKYRIYGKFPLNIIIHILLVVFTTIQALIILGVFTDYFRAQEKSLTNILISYDSKENRDYPRKTYLYDIPSLQDHIENSVEKMLDVNNSFLTNLIYVNENNEEIEANSIEMDIEYKSNIKKIRKKKYKMPIELYYNISSNNLGPFNRSYNENEIKKYLNIIEQFELEYRFKTYVPYYYKEYKECFIWKIKQKYDFIKKAHFEVSLYINNEQCEEISSLSKFEHIIIAHLWIHLVVIILSTISVFLSLYNFYEVIKLNKYRKIIKKEKKQKKKLDDKILKEGEIISKTLNKWDICIIISNICQIIGSILGLLENDNMNGSIDIFIGFGVMLCYICLGKYLDYNTKYALFYQTLKRSIPNVVPFFIGIMPIFIGFTFLGLMLFWNSERFTNVTNVMKALFAIVNGDSVYDIIVDITDKNNFFGQVYGYLFTILFIIVVMNVFIAIIQEAYVSAKVASQSHWIYSHLLKTTDNYENENLKNLPNIEEMSQTEIKAELENRIILMNKGLNKCRELIEEVEKKDISEQEKNELRNILLLKIEEIDQKMEVIRIVWENK